METGATPVLRAVATGLDLFLLHRSGKDGKLSKNRVRRSLLRDIILGLLPRKLWCYFQSGTSGNPPRSRHWNLLEAVKPLRALQRKGDLKLATNRDGGIGDPGPVGNRPIQFKGFFQ
jgi:hypothetical protein